MSFNLKKIENMLEESNTIIKESLLFEREIKYKYLQSFYSKAYLSGSFWYVGPTIKDYIKSLNLRLIFYNDYKLKFLYGILDSNKFPPIL